MDAIHATSHDKPIRIELRHPWERRTLAVGGELKNTVCVGQGGTASISACHGDLSDARAYRNCLQTLSELTTAAGPAPDVVACDLHPSYQSTIVARGLAAKPCRVQHHHAHAISCAIDAEVPLPAIGVVCDGAGYGADGAVWGGEILLCRATSFTRVGHLDYFPLAGGDLAARFPWRPALAVTRAALGAAMPDRVQRFGRIPSSMRRLVTRQLDVAINTPLTSSLGRLFDAAAFLMGLCDENTYEGQAAMAVQDAAGTQPENALGDEPYPFALLNGENRPTRIDWRPMIRDMVDDVDRGLPNEVISRRFHEAIVRMFADTVQVATARYGVDRVVLSGGCFHNTLLVSGLSRVLRKRGLSVRTHRRVSCGDAGLSLGQAAVAVATAAECEKTLNGVQIGA